MGDALYYYDCRTCKPTKFRIRLNEEVAWTKTVMVTMVMVMVIVMRMAMAMAMVFVMEMSHLVIITVISSSTKFKPCL